MLNIQNYLRTNPSFDGLKKELGVFHRRHVTHDNLILFKYHQKDSPDAHPVVRECRGIILDEANDWRVVCRAFDRFFNYGEGHAADIDWSTARVQEKLDGSLCVMYHYAGKWHVATSGSPDASGKVRKAGVRGAAAYTMKTFADYFWETFKAEGGEVPAPGVGEDLCFAFELMGPDNRVVVVHDKPWMRLLSVRDRVTGEEFPPEQLASAIGIRAVRSFSLGSFEEIGASFEHISPVSQEGYVVVDAQGRRVKVKHPGYVALHHAKDGMGAKAFVRIAQTGETPEVIAAFPEFAPMLKDMRLRYSKLCAEVDAAYTRLKDIPSQKDFAIEAVKTPFSATLFAMRRNGGEADDKLRDVDPVKVMELMGVSDEPEPELVVEE